MMISGGKKKEHPDEKGLLSIVSSLRRPGYPLGTRSFASLNYFSFACSDKHFLQIRGLYKLSQGKKVMIF
jgi:hypothetical protein